MANRGELTEEVRNEMEKFLGRETDRVELQFIPYIQYVMVNEQKVDPRKINREERAILSKLRSEGHVEGGMSGLAVTEEYWNFMCRILMIAYVDYEER